MYYAVSRVRHIDGHRLWVAFENGKDGEVDLSGYVEKGGVFGRFADLEYFKKVHVNQELGVLCWPGDVDIAPETLYSMVTGDPLPEWMEKSPGK